MEKIEGLSDIPDIEDPDIYEIGTERQDGGSTSTLYVYNTACKAEVVVNEADVLPCMGILPSPEDEQYAVRDKGQESLSCIPTPHSSNSAIHQSQLEIQREILEEVRDYLRSIDSNLKTLVAHKCEKSTA
ncbi:hypothetical protein Pmani_016574 [Petrolisthes manimaculis]|uniref:Uncharacterized protein n=1 Tax=Petrolisthes manimaculis TaxID=1843537 RepID=A0AAE1PRZ5_9EUCA|nr:hypothetical protein Pmani_016574 [Petrolisthes manimaculis]